MEHVDNVSEPTRAEIDAIEAPVILEFGASWCPHCRAAQPHIAAVLSRHPGVRRIKVEDGQGRLLGRSFRVKLWPTLIFMQRGVEIERVVRPTDTPDIERACNLIDAPA